MTRIHILCLSRQSLVSLSTPFQSNYVSGRNLG